MYFFFIIFLFHFHINLFFVALYILFMQLPYKKWDSNVKEETQKIPTCIIICNKYLDNNIYSNVYIYFHSFFMCIYFESVWHYLYRAAHIIHNNMRNAGDVILWMNNNMHPYIVCCNSIHIIYVVGTTSRYCVVKCRELVYIYYFSSALQSLLLAFYVHNRTLESVI